MSSFNSSSRERAHSCFLPSKPAGATVPETPEDEQAVNNPRNDVDDGRGSGSDGGSKGSDESDHQQARHTEGTKCAGETKYLSPNFSDPHQTREKASGVGMGGRVRLGKNARWTGLRYTNPHGLHAVERQNGIWYSRGGGHKAQRHTNTHAHIFSRQKFSGRLSPDESPHALEKPMPKTRV